MDDVVSCVLCFSTLKLFLSSAFFCRNDWNRISSMTMVFSRLIVLCLQCDSKELQQIALAKSTLKKESMILIWLSQFLGEHALGIEWQKLC